MFYFLVGAVIPVVNGKAGSGKGQDYRNAFGSLNTCVLDNLYGLEEILQYHQEKERLEKLGGFTEKLGGITEGLKKDENRQRVVTDGVILLAGVVMAAAGGMLLDRGKISGGEVVIAAIAMMSSFGPTAALSALSNNLHHTLAAGNRLLNLLEEEPVVEDIVNGVDRCEGDIACRKVSYGGEKQRIGIARAFLHDSRILFLDEPTSNIDSLNEGMILRSLEQEKEDKTIILVSHRKSTMGIAQEVHAL